MTLGSRPVTVDVLVGSAMIDTLLSASAGSDATALEVAQPMAPRGATGADPGGQTRPREVATVRVAKPYRFCKTTFDVLTTA
eukprot:7133497-Prymnesium_polylepis.1